MKSITGPVATLILLSGCVVNDFEKYYTPAPNAEMVISSPNVEHSTVEPKIYTYSADPKADNLRAQEEGYIPIGSSSFYGSASTMTKAQLLEEAKRVGAALVLVHSQHKDTVSGVVPYTVANPPKVSTVDTNGTLNSYGSGGYATGTYNSQGTITTPGGTSIYAIPYSYDRNDVFASYWVHQDPNTIRLGAGTVSLPDADRARLQRNTGVLVNVVGRGTPAFRANILRGDIILKIGGQDVIDSQGFKKQVTELQGQTVDIEILRGDTPKTVTVTLNRPR